jgi:hypothetical protein
MNKIVLTLTLILLSSIFALPAIAKAPPRSTRSAPNQERSKYEYADGAGNVYIINPKSIDYRPITKTESSSGNYEGGKPRIVKIDTLQYQAIVMMLDRALNLKSIHAKQDNQGRAKGTGMISKQAKNRPVQTQLILMDSQERREIEAFLDRLIGERQTFGGTIN